MTVVELGGGGAEPVSLAEAKAWCRIDRADEDGLIGNLVKAAREAVERETRLVLVKRNFRIALGAVPPDRRIAVPRRPLGSVAAVTAYGADGLPKSFPIAGAAADRFCGTDVLRLSEEVAGAASNGVEIDFAAGLEASAVPEALRLAIRQIVAACYEVRGAVAAEMQPAIVPRAVRDLIAPWRERRL